MADPRMQQAEPISLDKPATVDRLGFDVYVRQIVATIRDANARNQLPLTIGIYGRWGSGKTSLMKMVEARLAQRDALFEAAAKAKIAVGTNIVSVGTIVFSVGDVLPFGGVVLAWIVLLVAGILSTSSAATVLQNWIGLSRDVSSVLWLSMMFGGLGVMIQLSSKLARQITANELDRRRWLWYLAEPVLGLGIGALAFFVSALPLNARNVPALGAPAVTTIYLMAWLVGLSLDGIVALVTQPKRPTREAPDFQIIEFNAWKYANEDELWAALLQRLLGQMQINFKGWRRVRVKSSLWWRSIEWESGVLDVTRKLMPTVGKALFLALLAAAITWIVRFFLTQLPLDQAVRTAGTVTGLVFSLIPAVQWISANVAQPLADLDLNKYRKKASYKEHLTFLADFSKEFAALTRLARGVGNPIVLILDDLDRCLPDQAVAVLEAIKLFVGDDAPVVFLIGADREYIERAIEVKYTDLIEKMDAQDPRRERFSQLGHEYLEKIVQLPFNLPPIEPGRIDRFIDETFADDPRVTDLSEIFTAGLLPNPRQVLRVINIFRFVAGLANERGDLYFGTIDLGILAKLVIIQYRWPDLYTDIVDHPDLLGTIENSYQAGAVIPEDLKPYVTQNAAKHDLRRLLTLPPTLVNVDQRPYLFLTARAQTQSQAAAQTQQAPVTVGNAAPMSAETSTQLQEKAQALSEQIRLLSTRGGDTALVTRLLERVDKARSLLTSNDLTGAHTLLDEVADQADKALLELEARDKERAPQVIKAIVSKEGHLLFQRALSYERVEIRVETVTPDQSLRFRVTTSRSGGLEWVGEPARKSLEEVVQAKDSQPDLTDSALGRQLASYFEKLNSLSELRDPNFRLRFRLTCEPPIDDLPWEWASLPNNQVALGIDPRHCFVRGRSLTTPLAILPPIRSSRLSMLIANTNPTNIEPVDIQFIKAALEQFTAIGAIEVKTLEGTRFSQLVDEIKRGAEIVHLIAPVNTDASGRVSIGFEGPEQSEFRPMEELATLLAATSVRIVVLDRPSSRPEARRMAEGGIPAVVTWQARLSDVARQAFILAFYNALLRTGQADFALTEGRRSIAAQTKNMMEAVSPIMYLNVDDGIVFSN